MTLRDKKKTGRNLLVLSLMLACAFSTIPPVHAATAGDSDELRFPIKAYQVNGNSLLKADVIDRLLQPYTGSARSFSDIEAAREALQHAYQTAGYSAVAVTLPEQTLQGGIVNLTVVEAHLATIYIANGRHYDRANVLNSLPALVVGQVPNMHRVDEELTLANDNPGKTTAVVLRKGVEPNTINASVQVQDSKPWRTFFTLDNSGNAQTGKFRLGLGYQYANVANRDQVLTLQYLTSPDHLSSVSAYGAGYHIPLYSLGDSLDLFAGYANINAGTVAQLFSVSGKGSIFGLRYNQHLSDTARYKQQLIYGIDYRAYRNDISFVGTPIGHDVTVHPLSLAYSGRYSATQGECNFALTALQNIAGGAHGNRADFALARTGASADYRLLRLTTDCRRAIGAAWQIRLKSSGQYTSQPLVPGEQFGLGGLHSVRGFDERQFAGDKGLQVSLELYSPDVSHVVSLNNASLRGLVFYDAGFVSLNDAQAGDIAHTNISSAGFGLRVGVAKRLSLELDYAHILRAGNSSLSDHNRVQGSLTLVF